MKSTLKLAMVATALIVTQPAFAADRMIEREGYNTTSSQRIERSERVSKADRIAARERAEAERLNRGEPNAGYANRRNETRWMGMRATDVGTKDGSDNDVNNRSAHNFVMGKKASNVVRH